MFILYAPLLALVVGLALGGRIDRLSDVRFRWLPAIGLALLIQVPLFGPLTEVLPPGDAVGVALYVASLALVLAAVLANVRQTGMPLLALGAALDGAAIVANGGLMPATPEVMAALGWNGPHDGFSNSAVMASPALPWLIDRFATPRGLPFANVFSIGDVLIGAGVGWFVVRAMRPHATGPREATA